MVNEWLTRDTDSACGVDYTLVHDVARNLTDDGKTGTYLYENDAFGPSQEGDDQGLQVDRDVGCRIGVPTGALQT